MILSEQKPFEEIQGYLQKDNAIFVLGCNGCAQSSGSGGPLQVKEMTAKLEAAGKKVTGSKVLDFLCSKSLVKSGLRPRTKEIEAADSILVMTCGIGVQTVAASVKNACHPACNTINLGGSRGQWMSTVRCQECGQCLLDYTGGICPVSECTKSLANGPCGGASQGKCEFDRKRNCGWELIYDRLKEKGQLDRMKKFIAPVDYSKFEPKAALAATSKYALEQSE
ncbi:MAG: methylenetetrahydrofolate reductase C-terminal domain-containing protein [Dehalococcoidales bacterium]|nr:methylenetetrahydrofolate reductase C-terminal domain-containing protein [Dehalococcoidales bacterium]